ncbi:MAG: hypothetical protein JW774_12405 [Candidatus Aureabacteria bacterium]|nr:hypothetical protein [Candidatus Auribacterota bacterium]
MTHSLQIFHPIRKKILLFLWLFVFFFPPVLFSSEINSYLLAPASRLQDLPAIETWWRQRDILDTSQIGDGRLRDRILELESRYQNPQTGPEEQIKKIMSVYLDALKNYGEKINSNSGMPLKSGDERAIFRNLYRFLENWMEGYDIITVDGKLYKVRVGMPPYSVRQHILGLLSSFSEFSFSEEMGQVLLDTPHLPEWGPGRTDSVFTDIPLTEGRSIQVTERTYRNSVTVMNLGLSASALNSVYEPWADVLIPQAGNFLGRIFGRSNQIRMHKFDRVRWAIYGLDPEIDLKKHPDIAAEYYHYPDYSWTKECLPDPEKPSVKLSIFDYLYRYGWYDFEEEKKPEEKRHSLFKALEQHASERNATACDVIFELFNRIGISEADIRKAAGEGPAEKKEVLGRYFGRRQYCKGLKARTRPLFFSTCNGDPEKMAKFDSDFLIPVNQFSATRLYNSAYTRLFQLTMEFHAPGRIQEDKKIIRNAFIDTINEEMNEMIGKIREEQRISMKCESLEKTGVKELRDLVFVMKCRDEEELRRKLAERGIRNVAELSSPKSKALETLVSELKTQSNNRLVYLNLVADHIRTMLETTRDEFPDSLPTMDEFSTRGKFLGKKINEFSNRLLMEFKLAEDVSKKGKYYTVVDVEHSDFQIGAGINLINQSLRDQHEMDGQIYRPQQRLRALAQSLARNRSLSSEHLVTYLKRISALKGRSLYDYEKSDIPESSRPWWEDAESLWRFVEASQTDPRSDLFTDSPFYLVRSLATLIEALEKDRDVPWEMLPFVVPYVNGIREQGYAIIPSKAGDEFRAVYMHPVTHEIGMIYIDFKHFQNLDEMSMLLNLKTPMDSLFYSIHHNMEENLRFLLRRMNEHADDPSTPQTPDQLIQTLVDHIGRSLIDDKPLMMHLNPNGASNVEFFYELISEFDKTCTRLQSDNLRLMRILQGILKNPKDEKLLSELFNLYFFEDINETRISEEDLSDPDKRQALIDRIYRLSRRNTDIMVTLQEKIRFFKQIHFEVLNWKLRVKVKGSKMGNLHDLLGLQRSEWMMPIEDFMYPSTTKVAGFRVANPRHYTRLGAYGTIAVGAVPLDASGHVDIEKLLEMLVEFAVSTRDSINQIKKLGGNCTTLNVSSAQEWPNSPEIQAVKSMEEWIEESMSGVFLKNLHEVMKEAYPDIPDWDDQMENKVRVAVMDFLHCNTRFRVVGSTVFEPQLGLVLSNAAIAAAWKNIFPQMGVKLDFIRIRDLFIRAMNRTYGRRTSRPPSSLPAAA